MVNPRLAQVAEAIKTVILVHHTVQRRKSAKQGIVTIAKTLEAQVPHTIQETVPAGIAMGLVNIAEVAIGSQTLMNLSRLRALLPLWQKQLKRCLPRKRPRNLNAKGVKRLAAIAMTQALQDEVLGAAILVQIIQ